MLESRSAYGYYGEFGGATGETPPRRICPVCGGEFHVEEMAWTYDCNGIPFRFVCVDCWDKCMEHGYDGQYYTELDENIDEEW